MCIRDRYKSVVQTLLSQKPCDSKDHYICDTLQLALVVAQHRSRNNALSGVQLSALSVALSKLSQFARRSKGACAQCAVIIGTALQKHQQCWYKVESVNMYM